MCFKTQPQIVILAVRNLSEMIVCQKVICNKVAIVEVGIPNRIERWSILAVTMMIISHADIFVVRQFCPIDREIDLSPRVKARCTDRQRLLISDDPYPYNRGQYHIKRPFPGSNIKVGNDITV